MRGAARRAASEFHGRQQPGSAGQAHAGRPREPRRRPSEPRHAANARQQVCRHGQGVTVAQAGAEQHRHEFVVAQGARARPEQLLARAITRRQGRQACPLGRGDALSCPRLSRVMPSVLPRPRRRVRYTAAQMPVPARWRSALLVALAAAGAACASPPTKELSLAEGAIEAARAAGAAEFATAEFTAAVDTLSRARADVTAGDYRAALGHALDANTRAQGAARAAADGRVKARLAADETLDVFAALIGIRLRPGSPPTKRSACQRRPGGASRTRSPQRSRC